AMSSARPHTPLPVRPVARGMRAFLYLATVLTFAAGLQATVLAEHSATFFAWDIQPPMGAVFIGASFWSACVLLAWSSRQRDWARARITVPSVAVVSLLLLGATLAHIDQFGSLLGIAWIEVYAFTPPLAIAFTVVQLAAPGRDPERLERLPAVLRGVLGAQTLIMAAAGLALWIAPNDTGWWPWVVGPMTAKAIGTWLLGTATVGTYLVVRDDREDLPGAMLSYVVLGALLLLGALRFGGDFDDTTATAIYLAMAASTLAVGLAGAWLCQREGRYRSVQPVGGLPVQLAPLNGARAADTVERDESVRLPLSSPIMR
ncbi:MAG: hypothetical protein M3550_10165, partial [Actinomycetota bacterium]|nr:hypothetical protein [Actinomycetota bacterium]